MEVKKMKVYVFDNMFGKRLIEHCYKTIEVCFCKDGTNYFKVKIDDYRNGITFFSNVNCFNSSFMKLFYPLTDSQLIKLKKHFNRDCGEIK
jgi:hypothetical protein